MSKRTNKYKIRLEQISSTKDRNILHPEIALEFENHDEIFHIIDLVKAKKLLDYDTMAIEFALSRKMFSEVVFTNQDKALFNDFMSAMANFMKVLSWQVLSQ